MFLCDQLEANFTNANDIRRRGLQSCLFQPRDDCLNERAAIRPDLGAKSVNKRPHISETSTAATAGDY
jgi:hypothetical protein